MARVSGNHTRSDSLARGGNHTSSGGHAREQSGTEHFGAVAAIVSVVVAVALIIGRVLPQTDDATAPADAGDAETVVSKSLGELTGNRSNPLYAAELILPRKLAPIVGESVRVEGAGATLSQLSPLTNAIRAIEANGYAVGVSLVNLDTGASVSYNSDRAFYSASSIKGPYVTSVVRYELGALASADSRIDAIIRYSDNDAYGSFRNSYGNESMQRLVDASGAEQLSGTGITEQVEALTAAHSRDSIADNWYEFMTPSQMTALWTQCHEFLTSDEPGASWLAGEFETPEVSSLRSVGKAYGTTWAKAGWYPDEGDGYETTVDAGVVRTDCGDVVVCVMTTAPEDFSATASVLLPLLQLNEELG